MKTLQIAFFVATGAVATMASAQTAGDPVKGKARSWVCSGCHGVPGTKTAFPDLYSVPKLGGQHADYIVSALRAYKKGERSNNTMRAQASALSEADMADLGAYYSGAAAQVAQKK